VAISGDILMAIREDFYVATDGRNWPGVVANVNEVLVAVPAHYDESLTHFGWTRRTICKPERHFGVPV
jgi:hypothetical protein